MEEAFENKIILVNERDEAIGTMGKMEVHEKGLLHRAFSIFVFNSKNQLLLQKRANGKYHSNGLWTNTCCSHPLENETVKEAASRRLVEEMGMVCKDLNEVFSFIYQVKLDNNLTEHELDHVLIGFSEENPSLNREEAQDYKWTDLQSLQQEIEINPEKYTTWLKIIMDNHLDTILTYLKENNESLSKRNI